MIFEREKCKAVANPTAKRVTAELAKTRSSFASLTAADGGYVQVAGGPGLFVLERRSPNGEHYRAFQDEPVVPFPDGTTIESSAGRILMDRQDWFLLKQAAEVFGTFLSAQAWPQYVRWKKLDASFGK